MVVILGRLPVDQLLVMGQLHEKDRRRTQLEVAWVKAAAEAERLGLVDVVTKGWTVVSGDARAASGEQRMACRVRRAACRVLTPSRSASAYRLY